jgi:hypothetical protein
MTTYHALWAEVEVRLSAAFRLLSADAPPVAVEVEAELAEALAHNELELALDALLEAVENTCFVRRGFWEELAAAAMRMGLSRQFLRITDRIPQLEPHVFGTTSTPPFVSCDFNGAIEGDLYSLNGVGTALDFARLRLMPVTSQRLVLYDRDAGDDGSPTWLLADAVLVEHEPFGLVAKVSPGSFRSEPR